MNTIETDTFERLPPHDLAAETCAVGSLLLAGDNAELVRAIRQAVRPEDFYLADHGTVFAAAMAVADAGKPVDAIMVRERLVAAGQWAEIGGIDFLRRLLDTVPSPAHGPHYAAIVAERAKRRSAIHAAQCLSQRLYEPLDPDESSQAIEAAGRTLAELSRIGREVTIWTVGDAASEAYERASDQHRPANIEIGVGDIDDFGGLLVPGAYVIVGGRPSMGKSTLVRWMLYRASRRGVPSGLVAIEENRAKIGQNYLSVESGIENERISRPQSIGMEEWHELAGATGRLSGVPIVCCDDAFELRDVISAYEQMADRGCKIIAIDHIHLLTLSGSARRENRNAELTEISRQLKRVIKRTNTVGIVVAQLSRPEQKRGNPGPPTMRDLRDCGSLEQDADAIALIHRPAYYAERDQFGRVQSDDPDRCEVHVVKVRNGPSGLIVLREDLRCQRFFEAGTAEAF